MSKTVKHKFKVEGMHCSSCAMNIDLDLEEVKGVKGSTTNFAKQISEVEFDEELVSPDDLINAIKKTGYKAQPLDK